MPGNAPRREKFQQAKYPCVFNILFLTRWLPKKYTQAMKGIQIIAVGAT